MVAFASGPWALAAKYRLDHDLMRLRAILHLPALYASNSPVAVREEALEAALATLLLFYKGLCTAPCLARFKKHGSLAQYLQQCLVETE
eukprot:6083310-Pleurochrysis_carterae.AAC.1